MERIDIKGARREMAKPKLGPIDLPYAMLVVLVATIGLIMMFSASYAWAIKYHHGNAAFFLVRQGGYMIAGLVCMFVVSRVNYQYLRVFAIPLMGGALALLALVPFIGTRLNGAKRWIIIGEVSIQPSEIAKFAVIVMFAVLISNYKEKMKTFRYGVATFAVILVAIVGMLTLQPHLSGSILILGVGAAMLFIGGVNWGWFMAAGGVVGAAAAAAFTLMPHAKARLDLWLDPWADASGKGFQAIQSMYAVGSGGLFGLGLGQSRQKFLYLPEPYNDFVFAIVCEELGLVGAGIVLLLFAILILRGYWIALHSHDRFGTLLVAGVTTLLAMQTFLNVAVVTNLIPVTGISMPFFSYGGSSLMIQLSEMGVVLAVSRQMSAPKMG